ncbi:unnamed protein product [Eruca vesicaria subsp. sativa]|uniref:Uncharacterized protein n=1 Tax=Eruca vesicaria subsp. sativa TaxID=29727 RepID=A0ABC8JU31_ERUVS|nr:unnamed protein product [Eruca vesicaria subsp. sativa]
MNSSNQATNKTKSGEVDSSSCIIQIDPPKSPKILRKSAGGQSCCIFRIPHTLVQANEAAYKPKIVSIGPYHQWDGKDDRHQVQMIQEHKQIYLDLFLSKTKINGVSLTHLREVVSGLEQKIRDSYSEDLNINKEKLIDMMILDGCFILTLFFVVAKKEWRQNYDDPILMLRWILPTLQSDLLLLENQVPLFLLQELLTASKLFPSASLNMIIFQFFRYSIERPNEFWGKNKNIKANHILDLIRQTFIPSKSPTPTPIPTSTPPPRPFLSLIVSAKKLQLRGIKFMPKEKYDTPLDITLNGNFLEIPKLTFDDFFSSLLINCVAFEQFNVNCSTEMTSYVTFMGCLINTEADATYLSEKGIIENYFGTGEEVSLFFKNTGKDIVFSISNSYLADVFEGVNEYTSQGYHVQWAKFKYTYFKSPWTFLSSFAALILLIVTVFQAFFAAYPYFYPPK